jgi:aminoglycoside phosphotransferase (APT) family kinase protein
VHDPLQSRLEAYFAGHGTERPHLSPGPLVTLAGGWASSLYTFTVDRAASGDPHMSVLKLYAPDAGGREHAEREWRALTRLRAINYPVPHAVLCEPDARHLGHPFMVMDHIPGISFWQAFEAADPATRSRLTRSFVAQLVALHALDPRLLEPAAVVTPPYGYLDHELDRLRRDSAGTPHTILAEIVSWLEQRKKAVPCERPAILHRDYHPWNVLVDAAGHLWVLDWDWRIGDARFDLAWVCTLMQRSDFPTFSRAVRDEYARQSDRSIGDLAYFEVLTTVRWLLNVLPNAARRAGFREFLVEPVRRAQTFLHEHTGITADIRIGEGTRG